MRDKLLSIFKRFEKNEQVRSDLFFRGCLFSWCKITTESVEDMKAMIEKDSKYTESVLTLKNLSLLRVTTLSSFSMMKARLSPIT